MKLICIQCGNYTYFECDVQMFRLIKPTGEGIVVEDAVLDGFNWSDSGLRDELRDNVDYVLRQSADVLSRDADTGQFVNRLITCGRCASRRVTPPTCEWRPRRDYRSLQQEILDNREEYKNVRKEKLYADHLPVLWKP